MLTYTPSIDNWLTVGFIIGVAILTIIIYGVVANRTKNGAIGLLFAVATLILCVSSFCFTNKPQPEQRDLTFIKDNIEIKGDVVTIKQLPNGYTYTNGDNPLVPHHFQFTNQELQDENGRVIPLNEKEYRLLKGRDK